jgi:hypothetical protein
VEGGNAIEYTCNDEIPVDTSQIVKLEGSTAVSPMDGIYNNGLTSGEGIDSPITGDDYGFTEPSGFDIFDFPIIE